MPSTYNAQQKAKIQQIVAATATSERNAARLLKAHDWNVEQAANAHFETEATQVADPMPAPVNPLSALFDRYRDAPAERPDLIGVEGAMRYLQDLGVALDDITVLVISEMLQSPTLGHFPREGFMQAWGPLKADTIAKQKAHLDQLRAKLATDTDYFRRVYRFAFPLAKQELQRVIPVDTAIEYWRMVFAGTPPARAWATTTTTVVAAAGAGGGVERQTPWFDYFVEYLQATWANKAINRDQWNQTFEFHLAVMRDPSLTWWDASSAWPLLLDGFAEFVQRKWAAQSSPPATADASSTAETLQG